MSIERLDLQSPDLVNANFERLAALFPNCVTETAEGKAIDFDLREDSVDFDNTENLYIEGDNLEVLKLLQESYLGKIKMIYIDPPYNTGKDFVYKDNFTVNSEEWKEKSGDYDEYNQRLVVNPETSGRYHSDWLSMMYPRLKLARNLLKEDGVIFISIDDNEVHNLRKICDEIFGEANFVSNIIWHKRYAASNDAKGIPSMHDHIIVYQRSQAFERKLLPRTQKQDSLYKYDSNDGKGPWRPDNLTVKTVSESYIYEIINPLTGKSYLPSQGRCWLTNKETMQKWISEGRVFFGQKGDGAPQLKRYLSEVQNGVIPNTYWSYDEVGHTDSSRKELKTLFQTSAPFDNPKPSGLIKRIVQISTNEDDLILDFFSGSGTTGDAILQFNAENISSNRKFILVQIPEVTDEKSEAYKAGYKNICEIGKERIRRAARKIKEETGADIDYGFRVYRLDESNMQDVYYRPQDYKQDTLDLFADNVKPDRTADDLLAQVMLDWGLPLSLKIEQAQIAGKQVFKVAGDSLYACFDKGIDEEFANAIAQDKPLRIVFRDSGFKDDTAKTNVKQLLKQLSPETEMKVI